MLANKKEKEEEFVGWRSIFWPIYSMELKKFLPMAIMMMCMLFNYSVLRGLKDSLVFINMGEDAIPTLKLWFVLPAAVLFMLAYSKLSNIFSKNSVFYMVVTFFLGYFLLFTFVLYPLRQFLSIDFSGVISSAFWRKLLIPIGNWVFSSFYVMSELWGSAMVSLMFWRFANDVTSLKQSKRFYSMFGFVANSALMISGTVLKTIKDIDLILIIAIVLCLVIMGIYYWLNNYILTDPRFFNPDDLKKQKTKMKLNLGESLKYIVRSKYLGLIVLLVVCYGTSINLVEVMWKGQAKLLYRTEAEFSGFMGGLQIWTGAAAIICMLVGANVLRRCSWFTAAIITPLMIFATGLIFFGCIIYKDALTPLIDSVGGLTVLGVITSVGLLQNMLGKGTKYSLFDSTKEMSYIPLDDELKSKGKAAVEVIGGRAGKSGGAAIQFLLLNVLFIGSSLVELASVIALVFVVILILWFYAVSGLNKQFLKITANSDK
ncbi:MAG: NTP/NDP exchange transporter [Holosporaceae bacterium]|jgi:AAA family ATP:ADP antiporter|nr:NTP/NDP exchange transporter [Holosporaceae bacterium]